MPALLLTAAVRLLRLPLCLLRVSHRVLLLPTPVPGFFVRSPPVPTMLAPLTGGPLSAPCARTLMLTLLGSSLVTFPWIGFVVWGLVLARFARRVLSLRFNGRCPSCFRPFSAQHGGDSGATRPLAEGAPGVWDVFTSDRRVRSSVPKGAKDTWSRCLITALADVVAHRDIKSWTDLLTLPALVLPAPSRGGRKHVLRQEGETRRRCLD